MIDSKKIKRYYQWSLGLITAAEIEQEELDAVERPVAQARVEREVRK